MFWWGRNYSGVFIDFLITIMCFLARKITAEHAEGAELFFAILRGLCALCG